MKEGGIVPLWGRRPKGTMMIYTGAVSPVRSCMETVSTLVWKQSDFGDHFWSSIPHLRGKRGDHVDILCCSGSSSSIVALGAMHYT